ncbi:MAG TPA: NfeD family protein [Noviherbaspirillum sp.]|uniref:NfeD family protein n=1 Tax=Noviherbaspirillum sp. TaxID=1926288 RepID=UPI002B4832C4|nr:NfeD family protein [Noviherbaspirillum sp.]HJV87129.1 NfeD family protein [Noviherbaspirillum sp.]
MADWMVWFILMGVMVILEMFTGTFYLLMIGIGLAAGGVATLAGLAGNIQMVVAALVGIFSTAALRRSKWGRLPRSHAARDPNVNLDIGQTLHVDAWSGVAGEARTSRTMYRGALWDVELEHGARPEVGTFVIREVRGSRLIVANHEK